ncbi:protein dpy-30 homolog [Drosophila biarmipes]|uniref:protein dpy-30 homolog n=1 Tax=Drosophila biarmipes TaxID=125945 RepID=UPI0007E712F4|nr:protein dpy-30 homolog [Drosophila biarmipes]
MSSSRKASPHKKSKPSVDKAKKNPSAIISVLCPDVQKPKKEPKPSNEAKECPRVKNYKSEGDKRAYLEQEVVPILMEGMLGLAREMPRDPIGYLEKFWLDNKHKCDIELPQNIL